MNEIDYFKVFILYSDDMIADVYHLYIKKIISRFILYSYR
jgi:hypothetical protein